MRRTSFLSSVTLLAAVLGLGQFVGCAESSDDVSATQEAQKRARDARMAACHLNDGTVADDEDPRACEPDNKKKTTVCHVPPGNPANAHTLCIGNPAVSHHLKNHHGDYVGPCHDEVACTADAGSGGTGGGGDDHETGGTGGGAPGSGSPGGSGGGEVPPPPDGGEIIK
jgi:hypothetical protein